MTSPKLTLAPTSARVPLGERADEELMALGAAGSQAAFAVLVERYMRRVASYCTKLTGDRDAAPELAQDTFLQIWLHRERYRPERPFRVFLFTVATNRSRNHNRWWRRRSRSTTTAEQTDVQLSDPDQLDELLARERRRRVHEAIGALSPRLREVILLRFEQGLDYTEIAAIVGRPEATIRTRVFHALEKLREHIAEVP
ncbi:MAG: RNA polymerase sigma factor [Kofleriaceae bacterium]|nr:RNA polymerase sigma factor [Kofleriaceae bacterium]